MFDYLVVQVGISAGLERQKKADEEMEQILRDVEISNIEQSEEDRITRYLHRKHVTAVESAPTVHEPGSF